MTPVRCTNVDGAPERAVPDEVTLPPELHRSPVGWLTIVVPAVFLAYLVYVADAVGQDSPTNGLGGYVALGVFAASYLAIVVRRSHLVWVSRRPWTFWISYGLLVASFVAELPFAHATAFVMCLYITAIGVARFGARAAPGVLVLAVASLVVPVMIPAWHDSLGTAFDNIAPLAIPVVAVATYAVARVHRTNIALAEARSEITRLAAENERTRIARDLHDLLGHSLTTITLKAGLAHRLRAADPERAAQEIAAVEELSRHALAEVRSAVSSYREVTLATELAHGRELLRASGVSADLPTATDVVHPPHRELFAWAVREGLTNVARHARATSCSVTLSAWDVEIRDDGVGEPALDGNGLAGLRERAAAVGGMVEVGPLRPRGWRLRVSVSPEVAVGR